MCRRGNILRKSKSFYSKKSSEPLWALSTGPLPALYNGPIESVTATPSPLLKIVSPETLDTLLGNYNILVIFENINHKSKYFLFPHYFSMKNNLFPREFLID